MFSRRAQWNAPQNRLTVAREQRAARGDGLLDLTESNPTRADIVYPLDEISEAFARASRASYDPDPRGLLSARVTLAEHLGCAVDDLLVTASTSEAYSFLFKLLTDPGDAILTATPSYPLLEHLAALELVEQQSFALEFHGRWEIDAARLLAAMTARTRAVVLVNPNNPTGSFVTPEEQKALASIGVPIISDEVFRDYPLQSQSAPSFAETDALTFVLGGLSKSAGLPHLKLGWILLRGSADAKRRAMSALELIADNFLSVSAPVQNALPDLLRIAPQIRSAISSRTRLNLEVLTRGLELAPSARPLPVEGGWSAVVRVPAVQSDEELALRMLEEHGVLVQPGYFFDFDREGFLVLSLLTRPEVFSEGIARICTALPR